MPHVLQSPWKTVAIVHNVPPDEMTTKTGLTINAVVEEEEEARTDAEEEGEIIGLLVGDPLENETT